MKKYAEKINQIIEIVINVLLLYFLNVKFFHSSGVTPVGKVDGKNVFKRVHVYHSIYDNIGNFAYISVFFVAIAILITLIAMISKNKKIKNLGHVLSLCSVVAFVVLFICASTVQYDF